MQTTGKNMPERSDDGLPRPPEAPILRWLHRLEDGLLSLALVSMMAMAVLQILLRVLFHTGVVWGDEFVRVLVLWLGLLGAMSASRTDRHIRIDLVSRYLPDRLKAFASGLIQLATCLLCALAAWYSVRFVLMEYEFHDQAFAAVPAWICELIIPLGFAVIAIRYGVLSVNRFKIVLKKSS